MQGDKGDSGEVGFPGRRVCNFRWSSFSKIPSAASPATGLMKRHFEEQAELVDDALTVGKQAMSRIATRKAQQEKRKKKA